MGEKAGLLHGIKGVHGHRRFECRSTFERRSQILNEPRRPIFVRRGQVNVFRFLRGQYQAAGIAAELPKLWLGLPFATLRTVLRRTRQRYRDAVREEVANTMIDPSEVDDELRYLYRLLLG